MTDVAGRTLERKVDADALDHDARFALTMQRVRTKTGIVAFWYGKKKPHQSAVKVAIGFDVVDPIRPERVISHPETLGWVLAATTLEDLFEATTAQCGARLLDLTNWRSIGVYGEAAAFLPKGEIKPQASTVDAFGRPRDTRVPPPDDHGGSGALRFMRVPTSMPWQRLEEGLDHSLANVPPRYGSSLWDREACSPDDAITFFPFFQNTRAFAASWAGLKHWGVDTNLVGQGACLPVGHAMAITGISLFIDGNTRPLDQDHYRALADVVGTTACLDLRIGAAPGLIIPASLALPRDEANLGDVGDPDAFRLAGVAPAVYPLGQAIGLEPLQNFGVELRFMNRAQLDRLFRSESYRFNGVGFKVVLHGPTFGPMAG